MSSQDFDNDEVSVWATDTMVSLPEPPSTDILVNMGAFGFTEYGLDHNLTASDIEDYTPAFIGVPNGKA